MHGSDRESEPEKRLRASLWLVRPFQQEALFSECTDRYAQKLLDTADIVREAMFRQTREKEAARSVAQIWVNCHSPALQQPFRDVASIFVALAPVLQLE